MTSKIADIIRKNKRYTDIRHQQPKCKDKQQTIENHHVISIQILLITDITAIQTYLKENFPNERNYKNPQNYNPQHEFQNFAQTQALNYPIYQQYSIINNLKMRKISMQVIKVTCQGTV